MSEPMDESVNEPMDEMTNETTNEPVNEIMNEPVNETTNEPVNKPIYIRKPIGHEARTQRWGYFFVAPFVIVFCVFNLYPTINTFMLSFSNAAKFNLTGEFVGFKNFIRLVTDQNFWNALANTFIIWGFNFVPQLGIALVLAIWLSDTRLDLAGRGLFRAVVYMPNLLTAVSVAMLFRSLFGFGGHVQAPVNQILYPLGINEFAFIDVPKLTADGLPMFEADGEPILERVKRLGENGVPIKEAINFFRSVPFARGLVAFIQWWMWYGYTLIILMAGITSIPLSLFEAAMIDGASSRQTAWYITLPLLRPIMLFILVTSAIGGMQMFDIPRMLTDGVGSPGNSIRTTTVLQFNIVFDRGANDYGYGAAIAIGIFLVTIAVSLLIFFFLQDRSELKKQKGGKA
jgi:multiple sugar transport system permease protein